MGNIEPPKEGDFYIEESTLYFFDGIKWEKYFYWQGKPYSINEVEILIEHLERHLEKL